VDAATESYIAVDSSQADFSRLLKAEGNLAEKLKWMRKQFDSPMYFVRGNHEDVGYLAELERGADGTAAADVFDLVRYGGDGTVLALGDQRVAFLGGVEERDDERRIFKNSYQTLMDLGPGGFDVLVTHEGPYGTYRTFRGLTAGSKMTSRLIEHVQPAYHLAGHAHGFHGPFTIGRTTAMILTCIVDSPKWNPESRGIQHGWMAILDTNADTLTPVTDSWLAAIDTPPFDFEAWFEQFYSASWWGTFK